MEYDLRTSVQEGLLKLNVTIPVNKKNITLEQIIEALIASLDGDFALLLGFSKGGGFYRFRKKLFPTKICDKKFLTWVLESVSKAYCARCKKVFDLSDFYVGDANCKFCKSENTNREEVKRRTKAHYANNKSEYITRNIKRKIASENRTPVWADKEKLKEIYKNCPPGHHVDHIIPLQGELVSGLHIPENLQYLPAEENLKKSNKFTIA